MPWGWGAADDERPELERLAAELEGVFLSMPAEHQRLVVATLRGMVDASAGLRVIPDEVGNVVGRIVMRVFAERHTPFRRKPTPAELAGQIGKGAGRLLELLGVSPAELMQLVGGA